MELVYLWVEGNNRLKDVELNFGGENFFYVSEESDKTKTMTCNQNHQHIKGFFNINRESNVNISNVTAIAVENGVGKKTTILNYITANFGDIFDKKDTVIMQILFPCLDLI